jgi:Domain of unknown function (DUF4498)
VRMLVCGELCGLFCGLCQSHARSTHSCMRTEVRATCPARDRTAVLAGVLSYDEQAEFLWQLCGRLVVGGSLNQFEDNIEVYKEATRALYKELMAVQKDTAGNIVVRSRVYEVKRLQTTRRKLFTRPQRNNFCYLFLDPATAICRCIHHDAAATSW